METIESIPISEFKKGYKSISKKLDELSKTSSKEEKILIEYFYELMDEHFSTSDILPFE